MKNKKINRQKKNGWIQICVNSGTSIKMSEKAEDFLDQFKKEISQQDPSQQTGAQSNTSADVISKKKTVFFLFVFLFLLKLFFDWKRKCYF